MGSDQARQWVAEELATDGDEFVNTFETTIRVLGGLLSAFILSPGNPVRSSRNLHLLACLACLALVLCIPHVCEVGAPWLCFFMPLLGNIACH